LPKDYKNYNDFAQVCRHKRLQPKMADYYYLTALNRESFEKTFNEFIAASKNSLLAQQENWVNENGLDPSCFDQDKTKVMFRDLEVKKHWHKKLSEKDNVYVQKLVLDQDSDIAVITDLHGNVSFLFEILKDLNRRGYLDESDLFKIKGEKKRNFYMVFLGDYSDRGVYGLEVFYMLMRLKIANPENIILLRGNHERYGMNECLEAGFLEEFTTKLGVSQDEFVKKIVTMYDLMPSALYMGIANGKGVTNYAMLSHAGDVMYKIEEKDQIDPFDPEKILYNPTNFLQSDKTYEKIDLFEKYAKLYKGMALQRTGKTKAEGSFFVTRDFICKDDTTRVKKERGWVVGKPLLQDFLQAINVDEHQIKVMLRGHQHHGAMGDAVLKHGGIYGSWLDESKQWDGKNPIVLSESCFDNNGNSLWTFYSSTIGLDSDKFHEKYGKVRNPYIPTYVILKIKREFADWQLEPQILKRDKEVKLDNVKIYSLNKKIREMKTKWELKRKELREINDKIRLKQDKGKKVLRKIRAIQARKEKLMFWWYESEKKIVLKQELKKIENEKKKLEDQKKKLEEEMGKIARRSWQLKKN